MSKELDKYEYLTVKDLGCKPWVVEQAKFEYYPLGAVFNKGLDKKDKEDRTLKRLKNIEDKNEKQLKVIENKDSKQLGIKSVISVFGDELSQEGKRFSTHLVIKKKVSTTKGLALREIKT